MHAHAHTCMHIDRGKSLRSLEKSGAVEARFRAACTEIARLLVKSSGKLVAKVVRESSTSVKLAYSTISFPLSLSLSFSLSLSLALFLSLSVLANRLVRNSREDDLQFSKRLRLIRFPIISATSLRIVACSRVARARLCMPVSGVIYGEWKFPECETAPRYRAVMIFRAGNSKGDECLLAGCLRCGVLRNACAYGDAADAGIISLTALNQCLICRKLQRPTSPQSRVSPERNFVSNLQDRSPAAIGSNEISNHRRKRVNFEFATCACMLASLV